MPIQELIRQLFILVALGDTSEPVQEKRVIYYTRGDLYNHKNLQNRARHVG